MDRFPEIIANHQKSFIQIARNYKERVDRWEESILLKEQHTHRVCADIKRLCQLRKHDKELTTIAFLAALYHDIGRFEQFYRHQTFSDLQSENHALLSLEVMDRERVFAHVPSHWEDAIRTAIRQHNLPKSPASNSEHALLGQLLRDADKLDIWNTVIHYYHRKDQTRHNRTLELGLPDNEHITPEVLNALITGTIVDNRKLKSINDFKLLQLGWVFDVNFTETLALIEERKYLSKIFNTLPQTPPTQKAFHSVTQYVTKRLTNYCNGSAI